MAEDGRMQVIISGQYRVKGKRAWNNFQISKKVNATADNVIVNNKSIIGDLESKTRQRIAAVRKINYTRHF